MTLFTAGSPSQPQNERVVVGAWMKKVAKFAFFSGLVVVAVLGQLGLSLPAACAPTNDDGVLNIRPHQGTARLVGSGKLGHPHGGDSASSAAHQAPKAGTSASSSQQTGTTTMPKVARLGELPDVEGESHRTGFVMKTGRTAVLNFARRAKDAAKLYWLPITFGLVIAAFCIKSVIGCDCRCGRICRCRCNCDGHCQCLRRQVSGTDSHNSWMETNSQFDAVDLSDVAWQIFHHH